MESSYENRQFVLSLLAILVDATSSNKPEGFLRNDKTWHGPSSFFRMTNLIIGVEYAIVGSGGSKGALIRRELEDT